MSRSLGVADSKADIDEGVIQGLTKLKTASGSTIGFYGVTAVVQRTGATQTALTTALASVTVTGAYGFALSSGFSALLAQVEEIRAALVGIGLLAGS